MTSSGRTVVMTRRDRMVAAVSNFLFRFASPDYRAFVSGAVKYGMDSAARDDHDLRLQGLGPRRGPDWGMTMGSEHPVVLLDQPEDGYCESFGWVETGEGMTVSKARDLLAEFCVDVDGESGARPIGTPEVVYLRLFNPAAHIEDQRWVPCKHTAKTARKFLQFDATDTERVVAEVRR